MRRHLSLLLMLALAAACTHATAIDSTPPRTTDVQTSDGRVQISVARGAITVRNTAPHTIAIRLVEFEASTRVRLAPCTVATCATVPPGERRAFPATDAIGWSANARDVVVHVWTMKPGPDGTLVADQLETVMIRPGA
ncbi:MAG: hypothetical protein MUF00_00435 [Gemmatimonadaceae bacterium]|jgi:hypothetical protein|nr:hypothetical protein [Gemmatimonadaceae bacterium]